jgi:hypothetical protein
MERTRKLPWSTALLVSALATSHLAAATFTWDGGGDGLDLGNANNWNPNGIAAASDILLWDGVAAGPLALAYTTAQAGLNTNPGISISLTANQTSSLLIDGGASALRLNGAGISIAAGAGDTTVSGNITNGNSFVTLTVIPEPHAALLGSLGLLALLRRPRF